MRRLATGPARAVGLLVLVAAVLTAGAPSVIRIRPGDTLIGLARAHHTSVAALRALNHLPGNAVIYAGDTLRVPAVPRPEHAYAVRRGDTLIALAARSDTSVAWIRWRNHLPTEQIAVAQRLVLPGAAAALPAGTRVPGAVQRSAAHHRAVLAARRQPSKAQVRRLVAASARRNGVEVAFALAVAYHESGFQQKVVSPVDAIGVMQVLPSTGRALGAAYGRSFDLLSAGSNIDAGVLLLKQLVRTTGSQSAALAGYYQGLGSVHARGMLPQTYSYIRSVSVLQPRFRQG